MLLNEWKLAYLFSKSRKPRIEKYWEILRDLRLNKTNLEFEMQLEMLGPQQIQKIEISLLQSLEMGHFLLYPGHEFYPQAFLELTEVPYLLRWMGSPVWLTLPGISIVGSREASTLSLQWMSQELSPFLSQKKCFTASGGARGVDQKIHALSVLTEVPTVVFLPSGMSNLYPQQLKEWISPILSGGGAFVSEYEDNMPMHKNHFIQRNRLISAIGKATLIIEAKRRSGTMLTARQAIEQHRPVWVIPGHPLEKRYQGSLDLISEGATPVRDAEDLSVLFDSEIHDFSEVAQKSPRYRHPGLLSNYP